MKKILSLLFVIIGCSQQPTELERCIAKNLETEYPEKEYFSDNQFYCSTYDSYKKKTDKITAEFYDQNFRLLPRESAEEYNQRRGEYEDKYYNDLKKEYEEFKNLCDAELHKLFFSDRNRQIRKNEAENFCNSQGIY